MFQKGDYIIYGNTGACRVEEANVPMDLSSSESDALYYKLSPVLDSAIIYVPVTTTKFMRPVLTRQQALDLISQIPQIQLDPFEGRDHRMLADHYRNFIQSHDCEDLVQLIKTLYLKNQDMAERGKRASNTDLQYLKLAKELLHSELSIALGIPYEKVEDYVQQLIDAPVDADKIVV